MAPTPPMVAADAADDRRREEDEILLPPAGATTTRRGRGRGDDDGGRSRNPEANFVSNAVVVMVPSNEQYMKDENCRISSWSMIVAPDEDEKQLHFGFLSVVFVRL